MTAYSTQHKEHCPRWEKMSAVEWERQLVQPEVQLQGNEVILIVRNVSKNLWTKTI
jgi:hypothetical protein